MYKMTGSNNIKRLSDNAVIPISSGNRDYTRFLEDVKEHGTGIVEGADVVEPDYIIFRTGPDGYLPVSEQMDILTKDGLEAFQAANNAVKQRFPKTITGGESTAPLPDWVVQVAQ